MKLQGKSAQHGFTLIEIALALLVLGLLLGGGLNVLTAQVQQQRVRDTQRQLEEAQEAVLGFAITNGRLPCPASDTSAGQESFCTQPTGACGVARVAPAAAPAHGRCTHAYNGYLPAATLGLRTGDSSGFWVDAWHTVHNRIRYAVTTSNSNAFTAPQGMQTVTLAKLTPDLRVCASASGVTAVNCGTALSLTNNAVAVLYSLGPNASVGGRSPDEAANPNPNSADNDPVFVSHTPAEVGAVNGEFDDIVTWLSPNILFHRMVQAGRLP